MKTLIALLALCLCFSFSALAQDKTSGSSKADQPAAGRSQTSTASTEGGKESGRSAKPEIIKLTDEEQEQLKAWFERVKQLAAEADQAKALAEKAISDFNAAQGQLEAARAMRTALFYKLCAERKIDPATVELTADGIMKKTTTEKKTSTLSSAPQPSAIQK